MVILKKIRSATLVETLVASVIIVVVFMIASLSLNNIFKGTIQSKDSEFQNRIKQITYFYKSTQIDIPFYEDNNQWEISIEKQKGEVILKAENKIASKSFQNTIGYDK